MIRTRFTVIAQMLCGIVCMSLFAPTFALAQKEEKPEEKSKQEKKEEKQNNKDDKRVDKQTKRYDETLAKAVERYQKDAEFKEEIDSEYRQVQRDHAKLAFETNTLDSNDEVLTYTGDRLPKNGDTLYDNMLAQNYVNRLGQSLVPVSSDKRYGFKITLNPMPDARSLSTGTVYVSTGLLSLVDNEAQLSYILSHEIAHIEKDHWQQDIMVANQIEADVQSQERKANIAGAIGGGLFGAFGGKSVMSAAMGAMIGSTLAKSIAKLTNNRAFEWSLAQEDEADKLALDYMLKRNYDVREAQTFYETLRAAAVDDPRIELDRYADRKRGEDRRKTIESWVKSANADSVAKTTLGATNLRGKSLSLDRNTTVTISRLARNQAKMADDIKMKIQNGEIMAGDGEFENTMAILKRDNGIVAFYYDMYKLAARNLNQALAIRSDDSLGYFYYGKVLSLTARKPGEREDALQMFAKAIELDKRGSTPQARLYVALTKMSGRSTNNIAEIVNDLKSYVGLYQQLNGGSIPPNMNMIYDYLQEAGETDWTVTPVTITRAVSAPAAVTTATTTTPATDAAPVAAPTKSTAVPSKPAATKRP